MIQIELRKLFRSEGHVFRFAGASSTSCENSDVLDPAFAACPVTGCSVAFFRSAVTVKWALSLAGESTLETTVGYRNATGPLVVISTVAQQTHVFVRRRGIPIDERDGQFVFGGRKDLDRQHVRLSRQRRSVMLNS